MLLPLDTVREEIWRRPGIYNLLIGCCLLADKKEAAGTNRYGIKA